MSGEAPTDLVLRPTRLDSAVRSKLPSLVVVAWLGLTLVVSRIFVDESSAPGFEPFLWVIPTSLTILAAPSLLIGLYRRVSARNSSLRFQGRQLVFANWRGATRVLHVTATASAKVVALVPPVVDREFSSVVLVTGRPGEGTTAFFTNRWPETELLDACAQVEVHHEDLGPQKSRQLRRRYELLRPRRFAYRRLFNMAVAVAFMLYFALVLSAFLHMSNL